MSSIYQGCQIEDDVSESLREMRRTFTEYEKNTEAALQELADALSDLSGSPGTASVVIGSTTDNQVRWTALEAGAAGNDINIIYQYLGPEFDTATSTYLPRLPSAEAIDGTVYIVLAVDANGDIHPAYDTATSLPIWMAGTGVSELVTSALVGAGTDLPELSNLTPLSGGKDRPLTDAENAATEIAKEFGYNSYQEMMRSLDIPVIENEADAAQYLQSVDDEYIIVNKKLFVVEGTNLVGLRELYQAVQGSIPQMKYVLSLMTQNVNIPYMILTQTTESVAYEIICGEQQPTTTLSEVYRDLNRPVQTIADQYAQGNLGSINTYIFWVVSPKSTRTNFLKLESYGFSDDYTTAILVGEVPEDNLTTTLNLPLVGIVEDPTLLDSFNFTDAEIQELMDAEVEGIRPPQSSDPGDKLEVINKLLLKQPKILDTGLNTRIKKPVAAFQAIDMGKTTGDKDLSTELATRGKACARLTDNLDTGGTIPNFPEIPNLGIPDIPTADLSDSAKKIESAFGALSNVANSASKLFDFQVGGLLKTAESVVNKVQNLNSLIDNLLNNDLAKCILGTGSKTTGLPDLPSPSNPTGGGGGSSPADISIGGLPLPTSLLGDALGKLSIELDEKITGAVESVMELISIPLCIVRTLLESINGFDLGGALNPCKEGSDSNEQCPPTDVQNLINESEDLSNTLNSLPQTATFETASTTTEIEESVEKFTGDLVKSITTTDNQIDRGVQEVMDDIQKGINSKVEMVDKFTQAIRELAGDGEELANDAAQAEEEYNSNNGGCFSPSLGFFTDSIEDFI